MQNSLNTATKLPARFMSTNDSTFDSFAPVVGRGFVEQRCATTESVVVNGQRVNHEIANNRRSATPAAAKQWRRPEGCSGRKFQLTLWRPRCKLRRGQRRVGRGQQGRSKGAATAAAAITIGGIGVTAASVVVSESTVVEVIVVVVVAAVTVAVAVVVFEFRGG
ncbi:hypothetical protein G5I_02962 [Acromyrmex echinatior]|uniref:Uncharacterized protein n=1 Tax=Acromyrmex echinatior TaxID=103372 RepID=F4WBP3_ACREC|nr:hypothetical protein G5I_02962 [Acromyrmex echinatior]